MSPFDTITDPVARNLTRELYEQPVPCEVDWHKFHKVSDPPATHLAHFQCSHCDHSAPLLLCGWCVGDIPTGALTCTKCGKASDLAQAIIFLCPIGGPA
jgi:hypothetical protein